MSNRKSLEKKVSAIANELISTYDFKNDTIGLLSGKMGAAMFIAECYKYFEDESYLNHLTQILDNLKNCLKHI